MLISTKGRYALRVMLDLAEQPSDSYIPLKDIAQRQSISKKYLQSIIAALSKNHFVRGMRGKNGGYKLAREPKDYTVLSILELTDGLPVSVACLEHSTVPCERAAQCKTLPMWQSLDQLINGYLSDLSLQDVLDNQLNRTISV